LYNGEKKEEKDEDKSEDLIQILNERLETAKKTGKDLGNIYNELGNAYSNKKEFDNAIDCYKKALIDKGRAHLYYYNLGNCYESMGLYDEAISIYEKIKKLYPETAKMHKIDYKIMHVIDIKEGRIGKNGEDYNLAKEHYDKGNDYLEALNYESAFKEFNMASEINKTNLDYIFRKVMIKEIYESQYGNESDLCFDAIKACEKNDDFNYLPFFFTIYGDSISYEAWGHSKEASIYYEIAIYLLNFVPISERFAAPYYKLSRFKEQENKYEEALNFLKQVSEIDKTYKIDKDVNRILSKLRDGGEDNSNQEKKYLSLLKKYLSAKSYDMVIFEGKNALDCAPDNVEIYHLICQAAECKSDYYDMRWAAKEGLRLSLAEYDEANLFYYYIYILGLCCKFERKKEQAKFYFEILIDCDEFKKYDETRKAEDELNNLRYL
ncbi:MAG: tetratricopeptide repeat protein, partial [Candidatus Riflebacteria bacterium]|nr:tetratricopeptide repeat protein [Candidatus Riflebacteria bacterium]